ncbi:MAG: hypothetical protein AAFN77_22660 [Planctomycetota bacterium]
MTSTRGLPKFRRRQISYNFVECKSETELTEKVKGNSMSITIRCLRYCMPLMLILMTGCHAEQEPAVQPDPVAQPEAKSTLYAYYVATLIKDWEFLLSNSSEKFHQQLCAVVLLDSHLTLSSEQERVIKKHVNRQKLEDAWQFHTGDGKANEKFLTAIGRAVANEKQFLLDSKSVLDRTEPFCKYRGARFGNIETTTTGATAVLRLGTKISESGESAERGLTVSVKVTLVKDGNRLLVDSVESLPFDLSQLTDFQKNLFFPKKSPKRD